MLEFIKKLLLHAYMHYELATCIYVLEPWEKKLINGFVVVILGLLTFSSCVYLPSYIETFLQFLSPLPMDNKVGTTPYAPMLQTEKLTMG